MTTLEPRSSAPSDDPLEARIADALDARAALRRVDPASLEHRRALVRAAVDDGVVSLDVDDDAPVHPAPAGRPGLAGRGRRSVVGLLAAAAAAVLVVAGVGLAQRETRGAPPAASGSAASAHWRGMFDLDRAQRPADLEGVDLMVGDVAPDSVRSLAALGDYRYWAGWSDDGELCWAVRSPAGQGAGCNDAPSPTEPQEVSDGADAPRLYLMPGTDPDSSALEARGFAVLLPNVAVEADALGTANDLFARLRAPQVTTDAFPAGLGDVGGGQVLPESVRRLAQEGPKSLYLAVSATGWVCLYVVDGDVAGGACQAPVVVATQGTWVGVGGPEGATTAWLAPDRLDTSGWPALGRRQLTLNLWFGAPPGEELDPAEHRLDLADGTTAFVGQPYSGDAPAVLLNGRVTELDGGCLGVDDGRRTGVLVLQAGSVLAPDGSGVVTPSGVVVRVGDTVQGGDGGGGVAGTGLQELWRATAPECFADGREVAAVDVTAVSDPAG